jgi:hypothetical protein
LSEPFQPPHMQDPEDTTSAGHGTKPSIFNSRFIQMLGWVVLVMWVASTILDALWDEYEPHDSIHILMMAVAGAALGTSFVKPKNNH